MSTASFDVTYVEQRNRLTNAFRPILAVPHLVVSGVWQNLAQILGLVQWFIIVFTGRRNQGIFTLQDQWLGYSARAYTYASNMVDPYPPFGTSPGDTGISYAHGYTESADRLRTGLRLIWAIPALFVTMALSIAGFVVVAVSWFAILFTGRQPRGMFDFLVKAHRYGVRFNSYVLLMTDTYPRYE